MAGHTAHYTVTLCCLRVAIPLTLTQNFYDHLVVRKSCYGLSIALQKI